MCAIRFAVEYSARALSAWRQSAGIVVALERGPKLIVETFMALDDSIDCRGE